MGIPKKRIRGPKIAISSVSGWRPTIVILSARIGLTRDSLSWLMFSAKSQLPDLRHYSNVSLQLMTPVPDIAACQPDAIVALIRDDTKTEWLEELQNWVNRNPWIKFKVIEFDPALPLTDN